VLYGSPSCAARDRVATDLRILRMGAQRWLDLAFPAAALGAHEVALVLVLARYFHG